MASSHSWLSANGTPPSTHQPTGNMMSAATSARNAPKMIFSDAIHAVGSGASSLSSISFVKLNSITSGSAVPWSPVSTAVSAIAPGSSRSA